MGHEAAGETVAVEGGGRGQQSHDQAHADQVVEEEADNDDGDVPSDEETLSSGESGDSSDGDRDPTKRGRGNFQVGRQRAPRYSILEKHQIVAEYGRHFGKKVLPDGVMRGIRRAHNKWLRLGGVVHHGFSLKRTRHGLRQQEAKLFRDGWKWSRDGCVASAPSRQKQRKKSSRQKTALPSETPADPPEQPPVDDDGEWEGDAEMKKQSLKEKNSNLPANLAAMFAEADAALDVVDADNHDLMMTRGLSNDASQPQSQQLARSSPARITGIAPDQAPPATVQDAVRAPTSRRSRNPLYDQFSAAMADLQKQHDELFGPHRPGCGCGEP